jgi:hypothetical protein
MGNTSTCIIVTVLFAYLVCIPWGVDFKMILATSISRPQKTLSILWKFLGKAFYSNQILFSTMEELQFSVQLSVPGISKETFKKKLDTLLLLI